MMEMEMELVASLEGHEEERVWHACFSTTLLASCGADKTVRLWSAGANGGEWRCVAVLEEAQSRTIRACEFAPNGRYIACASFDATTVIWGLQDDGKWAVVASLEGHENEVKSVSWNASGSLLATCSRDKSVWIWDTASTTGEKVAASTASDGEEGGEAGSFECVSLLSGHTQDVKFVKWHPYEDVLISCSYDDTIRIWMEGVNDWFTASNLTGHANTVWGASFDETGGRFASCSQDCTVIIWKRNSTRIGGDDDDDDFSAVQGTPMWEPTQVIENLHSRTIFSVDWAKVKLSNNQQLIATCGADNRICILGETQITTATTDADADTEAKQPKFELLFKLEQAHDADVNCVRWHPTIPGLLVSTGDDGLVKLWRYPVNANSS